VNVKKKLYFALAMSEKLFPALLNVTKIIIVTVKTEGEVMKRRNAGFARSKDPSSRHVDFLLSSLKYIKKGGGFKIKESF